MTLSLVSTSSPWDNGRGAPLAGTYAPPLGLYVICGYCGNQGGQNGTGAANVATSPNGITWTTRTSTDFSSSTTTDTMRGIAWSPSLAKFCMVGQSTSKNHAVWLSTDGITWTGQGQPFGTGVWGATLIWSPDLALFIAATELVSGGGRTVFWTSPDGTTWTARPSAWDGITAVTVFQFAWSASAGMLVASVKRNDGLDSPLHDIATSPDGITWTFRQTNVSPSPGGGVAWSDAIGKFVLFDTSNGGARSFVSTNGTAWSAGPTTTLGPPVFPSAFTTPTLVVMCDWDVGEYDGITYNEYDLETAGNGSGFGTGGNQTVAAGGGIYGGTVVVFGRSVGFGLPAQSIYYVLDTSARLTQEAVESLDTHAGNARLTQEATETLETHAGNIRLTQESLETLETHAGKVRLTQGGVEVLYNLHELQHYLTQLAVETLVSNTSSVRKARAWSVLF